MKTNRSIALALAAAMICPAAGWSQSRQRAIGVEVGGSANTLGTSAVSRNFNPYSYGLGGLGGTSAPTSNVLQSSIGVQPSYSMNISRPGAAADATSPLTIAAPAAPTNVRAYDPQSLFGSLALPSRDPGLRRPTDLSEFSAMSVANSYMASLASIRREVMVLEFDDAVQPVSSFVPDHPGEYSQWMEEGEQAFREGDFQRAYQRFRLAYDLAPRDAESHLALAHASFAQAALSYTEPSRHLQRALQYLPELALTRLEPRAFFGDSDEGRARYEERIDHLATRIAERPRDAHALLLRAYFKWFEGDSTATRDLLGRAAAAAAEIGDEEMIEAVDIFWTGMLASGKVSGELSGLPRSSEEDMSTTVSSERSQ